MRLSETQEPIAEFIHRIAPASIQYMNGIQFKSQLLYRGVTSDKGDAYSASPRTDRRALHTKKTDINVFNQTIEVLYGPQHYLYRYRARSMFMTNIESMAAFYTSSVEGTNGSLIYCCIPSDDCQYIIYNGGDTIGMVQRIREEVLRAILALPQGHRVFDAIQNNVGSISDIQPTLDPQTYKYVKSVLSRVGQEFVTKFTYAKSARDLLTFLKNVDDKTVEIAVTQGTVNFVRYSTVMKQHHNQLEFIMRLNTEGQHAITRTR